MKILHTSDWHLGNQICGRKRYDEHEQFLSWLLSLINREGVDILIVAGDIFDTTTPPNRSLEQYYQFLARAAGSSCRQIIITAGNHDSPSLIAAPRELCKYLNITVVGQVPDDPEELITILKDQDGRPELIICPVPYLRDRDVRTMQAGESAGEKAANLIEGIKARYHALGSCAEKMREEMGDFIPIIATGHLFAAGGITGKMTAVVTCTWEHSQVSGLMRFLPASITWRSVTCTFPREYVGMTGCDTVVHPCLWDLERPGRRNRSSCLMCRIHAICR
jgi:exonuclease SbcD